MDRLSGSYSDVIQQGIQHLIGGLKRDGNWNEIDALVLPFYGNREDNLLNLKGNYWNAREIQGVTNLVTATWASVGGTNPYETFTSSGPTAITSAINTTGNGLCVSNSLGTQTFVTYRFRCTLTKNSGQNPTIDIRNSNTTFGALCSNQVMLVDGVNDIELRTTGTAVAAHYINIFNTAAADWSMSGIQLHAVTRYGTGMLGASNGNRWTWGSQFIPSVETTSKYRSGNAMTIGGWLTAPPSITVYSMGVILGGNAFIAPRRSDGTALWHIGGSTSNTLSPATNGIYATKRRTNPYGGAEFYHRGSLISTAALGTVGLVPTGEIHYSSRNSTSDNTPVGGMSSQSFCFFIGGDINIPSLDYRLNEFMKIKSLNY